MCTAVPGTHWLKPRYSPLPPHLGSYREALLVSQDKRHLFVTPCLARTVPHIDLGYTVLVVLGKTKYTILRENANLPDQQDSCSAVRAGGAGPGVPVPGPARCMPHTRTPSVRSRPLPPGTLSYGNAGGAGQQAAAGKRWPESPVFAPAPVRLRRGVVETGWRYLLPTAAEWPTTA
jgi:hypothetical protein